MRERLRFPLRSKIGTLFVGLAVASSAISQTGGTYDLSHNVIASGGGASSVGGVFRVDGTVGQPLAGTTSNAGNFSIRGGFWSSPQLAPTAANLSLSGRITCSSKPCMLRRVRVILTDPLSGLVRSSQPNPFGYYQFEELPAGRMYLVTPESSRFIFTPVSYSLTLVDEISDVNFEAELSR